MEIGDTLTSARLRRRHLRVWLAGVACVVLLVGVGAWTWHRTQQAQVVTELARIAEAEGVWDTPWDLQERKITALKAELVAELHPIRRLIVRRRIAEEYVNGGFVELGIASLEETIGEYARILGAQDLATLRRDLAFAFYRLGEQQNCSTAGTADVCILPLQNGVVHTRKLGAGEAIKAFSALLAEPGGMPDEVLSDRWFLNLAYMQLGKYPDAVPPQWLIPPSAFASDGDVGRFRDVASQRGLAAFGRAGGLVFEDFDNDGHLDLLISHMGLTDQLEYFHNDGNGHFTRMTEAAGLKGLVGGLNMVQADFDNDGCIDVYIPRGAWYHDKGQLPASLLKNNCDGTFTDVAAKAGVLNRYPSQTAVWADFNNDGLLDPFVGNEIVRDKVKWPADTKSFRLYINQGDGTFVDVAPVALSVAP